MSVANLVELMRVLSSDRSLRATRRSLAVARASILLLLLGQSPALGATTFTTGAGSAVSNVGRTATFDSLTVINSDLSAYTEGLLSITVPDVLFVGFDAFDQGVETGFHYGSSGNNSFVTIRGTDSATFFALELRLGDGFQGALTTHLRWGTFKNNVQISTGLIALPKGTIVGFSDPVGFDELRVAANNTGNLDFGEFQAIAIDDVKVQVAPGSILEIGLDIDPGVTPNEIDPDALGKIAVALLGNPEVFDVADVDVSSLAFGPSLASPFLWAGVTQDDVNGDEENDLIVFFRIEAAGLSNGSFEACLTGITLEEEAFTGCDDIVTPESLSDGLQISSQGGVEAAGSGAQLQEVPALPRTGLILLVLAFLGAGVWMARRGTTI